MRMLISALCIFALAGISPAAAPKFLPTTTTINPVAAAAQVERGSLSDNDSPCDNLGLCGNVYGPSGDGVFLGDFAFNCNTLEFAVIEVGGGDYIFTMTDDCSESGSYYYKDPSLYYSGRGLGYHQFEDVYFASSWNWYTTYALNTSFEVIASTYDGIAGAGNAVDEANNFLYQTSNASPDMLYEYTINQDYTITSTGRSWSVPWGGSSDGYSMASLAYDDNSGYFFMINQDANALEWFSLTGGSLINEGYCHLSGISFGWGLGLTNDIAKVADIESFYPPFPVYDVEAPLQGHCEPPDDWSIRYVGFLDEAVNRCGVPIGATVRNNTGSPVAKVLWITQDPPCWAYLSMGEFTFEPGDNTWYGCVPVNELPGQAIEYHVRIHVGDVAGGTSDDHDNFVVTLHKAGVQ